MKALILRTRLLLAKVMRRIRRIMANFTQPSDIEKLMAALPEITTKSGLKGAVVLVTGSTRGVGRAIAETLSAEGARVVVHGRDKAAAEKVASEISAKTKQDVLAVAADLSMVGAGQTLVTQARSAAGGLDIVVNNAGIVGPVDRPLWMVDHTTMDEVIRTNLAAVHETTSAAISHWLEDATPGRVINISTGAVEANMAKMGSYGVTKTALESLSAHFAADLDRRGIAVTTVRLGSVKTDMTKSFFPWEEAQSLPPPESVMPVILHAATAPWDAVTGKVFSSWTFNADVVSGGQGMAHRAAASPIFRYPMFKIDGQEVPRDSDTITIYDRAENQFGAAPQVKQALHDLIENRPLTIYPDDDYHELTTALGKHWDLSPDHFTVGAGSWDVLDRILKLYCVPGDAVIVNDPGWFGFTMLTAKRGLQQIRVPFLPGGGPNNRAHHNLDAMLAALTHKTRLIYLINPSNPEGVSLDRAEVDAFLAQVPKHIPVIIDEAYAEFATTPERVIGPDIVRDSDHPVFATRTFSKFYGLASLRIGYGVAKPDLIERLDRMALIFNVSKLTEVAAIAALEATDHNNYVQQTSTSERDRLIKAFEDMSLPPIPSDSSFLLVPPPCALEKYFDSFEEQRIFMPRAAFFEGAYVMFPVARPEQNDTNLALFRSLI
jgi:histidinol-phosphate aminotransferase